MNFLCKITPDVNHVVLEQLTGNSAKNSYNNKAKNQQQAKLPAAKRIEITSLWLNQNQYAIMSLTNTLGIPILAEETS